MKKSILKKVGIIVAKDTPANLIFTGRGKLSRAAQSRLDALREFAEAYHREMTPLPLLSAGAVMKRFTAEPGTFVIVTTDYRNCVVGVDILRPSASRVDIAILLADKAASHLGRAGAIVLRGKEGPFRYAEEDVEIAARLKKELNSQSVTLMDYIIVSEHEFFSFNDEITRPLEPTE